MTGAGSTTTDYEDGMHYMMISWRTLQKPGEGVKGYIRDNAWEEFNALSSQRT
jgi:hypothetical protein